MWDNVKDMIMQVDNVYLVCLTNNDYDMLVPPTEGCDERKFSS